MNPASTKQPAVAAFTAAQIAAALGIKRQSAQWYLREVQPAGVRIVAGNEAVAWTVAQLPSPLRARLAALATKQCCRTIEVLLTMPRQQWRPAIALCDISDKNFSEAQKLREALKPFLTAPPAPGLTAEEWKQRGAAYYFRVFKSTITPQHWDRLFRRTQIRDNGLENFDAIAIYLPDRLKRKTPSSAPARADNAQDLCGLVNYLHALKTPGVPDVDETAGIWALAVKTFQEMVKAGELEKRAARRVRQFLFAHAPFLAPSQDAIWIAFKRKISAVQAAAGDLQAVTDGRSENGDRVKISSEDVDRLRHSAAIKNGGRIDTAWREEYPLLSEDTRQRYPVSFKAPAKVHEILNREKIDTLAARHQGKRKLRRMVGSVQRDWNRIPSMHSWVVDDLTANIQVVLTDESGAIVSDRDGQPYLFTPQVIAVMDSASRKFVGWTPSPAKAPNAGIVCDAVLDGIKTHGVPTRLGVENGFVFGKSLLVNGKEDEQGRTMVAGLGQFGCTVDHFEKMNPQSKSELEFGFEQIQRLMERHPGYTGRLQMLDAPEEFRREERLIRAGKAEPKKYRYTFNEFISVLSAIVLKYNATPQQGRLKGLSPDEAFNAGMDAGNPPIQFTPKLEWLLNERQIVAVTASGVSFTHRSSRQAIKVRGGQLAGLVGEELWAVMDRRDASMVTFIDRDFTNTFTMEVCEKPSAREASFAAGSGVLAKERAKIREHERAISREYMRLKNGFGNPRQDLLAKIRGESSALAGVPDEMPRRVIVDARIESVGDDIQQQRDAIHEVKRDRQRQRARTGRLADRTGIAVPEHAQANVDPDAARRLVEFLNGKDNE